MKIGIVGAGNVGGTLAMRVLEKGLGEIVLLDVVKGVAQGKALDMNEAGPVIGYEPRILGTDDYEALKAADIVVVTAGFPRTPGMSREELLAKNLDIVYGVTRKIVSIAPDAIIIVVTNPLDLMTYAVHKIRLFTGHGRLSELSSATIAFARQPIRKKRYFLCKIQGANCK